MRARVIHVHTYFLVAFMDVITPLYHLKGRQDKMNAS